MVHFTKLRTKLRCSLLIIAGYVEMKRNVFLQAWQERWQLRFNPKKCNVMRATHATRKKIEFPYTLDDTPSRIHPVQAI